MISAITGLSPLSYLNQVKGISAAAPASSQPAQDTDEAPSSGSTTSNIPPAPTQASILGLSSDLLSLLQGLSSTSSNGTLVSTLTGGGTSDFMSGLLNSFLAQGSSTTPLTAALVAAQQEQLESRTSNNSIQSVLSSYHTGINAYNQTLLKNAADAVKANNGQLPQNIVA